SVPESLPLQQRKNRPAQIEIQFRANLTSVTISSFQSILAHIWRAVIRNGRQLDEEEVVQCKLMVDYRHRLRPNLPPRFFGNVVMFAAATATAGELVREGIGYAALRLNETVARQTDGEARKWLREEKVGRIGEIGRRSVVVADSPRFDVYGNDFGWGKPVAVRAAGNYSEGKLTVFAGKEEGSVDVQVCLVKETMDRIGSDSEFMEFVC
ncbi:Protein ENHANCED PSEUDOMONAS SUSCEPTIBILITY 1, partial [Linum perenne]